MVRKITLIRAALPVKCPSCTSDISWNTATSHVGFLCPKCRHGVHLRDSYFRVVLAFSFVAATALAYLLGTRGNALLWAGLLGLLPMNLVLLFVTMRLFPPDSESTGEFRGILYDRHEGSTQNDFNHKDSRNTRG